MILLFRILISTSLLGSVASTLSVYPHQLAYFNEASGGPENGYKHLLGSNLDWGQNLIALKIWLDKQGIELDEVRFFTNGSFDPSDFLSPNTGNMNTHIAIEVVSCNRLASASKLHLKGSTIKIIGESLYVFSVE